MAYQQNAQLNQMHSLWLQQMQQRPMQRYAFIRTATGPQCVPVQMVYNASVPGGV
jgi:hypothetical protein